MKICHLPTVLCALAAPFVGLRTASAQYASLAATELETPVVLSRLEVNTDRSTDKSYHATQTSTATRTDTPLINIPQSLAVVTQEQIQDQHMTNIGDVVRYVPGVGYHQGENNRDQVIFRGNSSSADFFVNGVRDDVQYYRDVYNLAAVEVLRGPNAMIFGRGGGGGVINRVTKEAEFSPSRELTLTGGSFNNARATLDIDQPFTNQVAGRLNAMFEDTDSFRDHVHGHRLGLNPTVTLRPDSRTKVVLSYEYLHDRRTADRGITSWQGRPVDVPIEQYYGDPADSHVNADVHLVTALLEHQTAAGVLIRNRTVFGDYDRGYQNYVPGAVNASQTLVTLSAYNNATQRGNVFNQTDFSYTLTTAAITHTLLGGIELGRQLTDNFRNTGYFNNTATSIQVPYENPVLDKPATFRQSATDADNHLKTDIGAVFVQDQLQFDEHWQAVLGLRADTFALQYHNNRTGDYLGRRDNLLSPRAGLIYKPAANASLYASYGVSYLPSSGDQFSSLTTITQQVKPEEFSNYEIGAKIDFSRNASVTAAVYQLDRDNTRATDPNDSTRIIQTGSQRTNGFELGVTGAITKRWTTSFGYAYQDAYIRSATTAARAGATVAQVPRHTVSLWNKVEILPNLSVGLGVVHRSDMFAAIDNTVVLPKFTRIDAALYYRVTENWRLQLNVENLLDKKYYANADNNTNISPGAPRTIRVGLITRF